ncbi:MAG: kelch motif-containing protein, partial [Thermoplasmata archaeon]|nr:kelch motif-containing protein [Thermoplasmata archaeon]
MGPLLWAASSLVILGLLLPAQLPNGAVATPGIVESSRPNHVVHSTSSYLESASRPYPVSLRGSVASAPAAASAPQWVNVTPGIFLQPPPRANASVTWDANDGEYLLFGGEANGQVLGDTWVFHGGQWATVHSSLNPAPRYGAGLVYDPVDNYTVLFGGSNSSTRLGSTVNDTWSFAQGQWTRLTPTTPPRGRAFPSMAFDPLAGRIIMFGGFFAQNQSASTWGYVSGNWTSLVAGGPSEPPDRVGGSMAFDTAAGRLIMFGGLDPETKIPITLNDTWSFVWTGPVVGGMGNWTNLNLAVAPSTRYDAAMAYDASETAIVLFGGATLTGVPLGDTWLWTPTGWTKLSFNVGTQSPTVRYGSALAPSPSPGASPNSVSPPLLLFSGLGRGGQLADETWFFGALSLAALPPRIDRPSLDVGTRGTVSELAFGGATPYTYSWNLLPPGCPAPNRTSFTCTPSVTNTYQISANVKDALGASMTSTATSWVVNAPPSAAA